MQRISKNLKYLLAVLVVSVTIVMGLSACAPAEAGTDYNPDYTGTYYLLFWHEAGKLCKNNLTWSAAEIENIESYRAMKDASDFEHG